MTKRADIGRATGRRGTPAGNWCPRTDDCAGEDRPVVFVHGDTSSACTWLPVLTGPFVHRVRCLAFDPPGHGRSAPAADRAAYSLPGYAAVLAAFADATGAADAVIVGWSLGGHIAVEAAPATPAAPGYVFFGTPPVSSAAQMSEAFLPNPAMSIGFTADVTLADARLRGKLHRARLRAAAR